MIRAGSEALFAELALPSKNWPLRLLWVEPGVFHMGSPVGERSRQPDENQFQLHITRGYWLGETPVTQAQYAALCKAGVRWPSLFSGLPDSDDRPVEMVSWTDANMFCEELSKLFAARLPRGYRFALPTEGEWEYACRAGTMSRYYSGEDDADLDRVAWHSGNSGGTTHPVGQLKPNPWGFFDILGNVSEWCQDWYEDYPKGTYSNWTGPAYGRTRSVRGRAWGANIKYGEFRCGSRLDIEPRAKFPWLGFRLSIRWVL